MHVTTLKQLIKKKQGLNSVLHTLMGIATGFYNKEAGGRRTYQKWKIRKTLL